MLAEQLKFLIDENDISDDELIARLLEIYEQKALAEVLNAISPSNWCRETVNRWAKGKASPRLSYQEYKVLKQLLPEENVTPETAKFRFIDLFAGIGGIRKGFEEQGGLCVFTSEWNKYAIKTYKANFYSYGSYHAFNEDIRDVTLSQHENISEQEAYAHINSTVPDHEILLAGFPCQPFSIAGVSKKNSLGRAHGFECETQGTLFFDVARIIKAKQPKAFVLENVKNLKSHDKGKTFKVIMKTLDELGYWVSDADFEGSHDPKIIDGQNWVPQHRERIVLVGFRKDLNIHQGFSLTEIKKLYAKKTPRLADILDDEVDARYTLTPKLWEYLHNYAIKHKEKGNGFGYGLVNGNDIARTLSARYYKDGSEILIDQGWDFKQGFVKQNLEKRPRRLTPKECARLMGFSQRGKDDFRIPVSDTQAYKQFGNSVVVPVFQSVAKLVVPRILKK
ncbi:MAG: DNA (cytosine-5-)-methyltransferase [Venatoribacter sp.]